MPLVLVQNLTVRAAHVVVCLEECLSVADQHQTSLDSQFARLRPPLENPAGIKAADASDKLSECER